MASSLPSSRLAYADLTSPREMYDDCQAAGANLGLVRLDRALRSAGLSAPSIRYQDFPRDVAKREIRVSDAAARLASALHLQWN